jgi:hypothetical protein
MARSHLQPSEPVEDTPLSQIYDFPGAMVRLWASGWACTCRGNPTRECEHIEQARQSHEAESSPPKKRAEAE